jgi:hypothetical protein
LRCRWSGHSRQRHARTRGQRRLERGPLWVVIVVVVLVDGAILTLSTGCPNIGTISHGVLVVVIVFSGDRGRSLTRIGEKVTRERSRGRRIFSLVVTVLVRCCPWSFVRFFPNFVAASTRARLCVSVP